MANRKIVVALGGNAILSKDASAQAQQQALRDTAKTLVAFIKQGDQLIISHGNGPQVGNLLLQQAAGSTEKNPPMPLDTAVAMTQGALLLAPKRNERGFGRKWVRDRGGHNCDSG